MLFQLLSKESDQSPNLNWKDSKKLTSTDQLDKNGTTKEMKAEDLKRKEKLLKRTDSFCLFKFIHNFFFNFCLNLNNKFQDQLHIFNVKDEFFSKKCLKFAICILIKKNFLNLN